LIAGIGVEAFIDLFFV